MKPYWMIGATLLMLGTVPVEAKKFVFTNESDEVVELTFAPQKTYQTTDSQDVDENGRQAVKSVRPEDVDENIFAQTWGHIKVSVGKSEELSFQTLKKNTQSWPGIGNDYNISFFCSPTNKDRTWSNEVLLGGTEIDENTEGNGTIRLTFQKDGYLKSSKD